MQYVVECWLGCGEDFTVHAPDRQDPKLVEGVPAQCTHCQAQYRFTVDGDGEPELESTDPNSFGQGASDPDASHY